MASFSLCQNLAWLVYVELKYEDRVSSLSRDTSDVSVIIGFMHIWCKDAKNAAYSIVKL